MIQSTACFVYTKGIVTWIREGPLGTPTGVILILIVVGAFIWWRKMQSTTKLASIAEVSAHGIIVSTESRGFSFKITFEMDDHKRLSLFLDAMIPAEKQIISGWSHPVNKPGTVKYKTLDNANHFVSFTPDA